jgi:hypothetical protein
LRYLCRSWWTCHSSGRHTWRNRSDALLATGQPISLIPREVQDRLELVISPERGWRGQIPSWFGVPCRIGRVQHWLPIEEEAGRYRDFALLALLPREDPDDAPPFILLGTQFLLEFQA